MLIRVDRRSDAEGLSKELQVQSVQIQGIANELAQVKDLLKVMQAGLRQEIRAAEHADSEY